MSPDIQEMKEYALAASHPDWDRMGYIAAASPSTILALIEVAEAGQALSSRLETYGFPVSDAARPTLVTKGAREAVELDDAARKLRTALEGVKP